jgi:transcriptional regulator with XRE-family HTH domain
LWGLKLIEKNKTMEARKRFGVLFRTIRKRKKLSQTKVGELCGVSYQTINKVEQGLLPYSVDLIIKLGIVLDFNIEFVENENS